MIHNDLQLQNLIINLESNKITGVIDWTDVCVGMVEGEFTMWEGLGSGVLEHVANLYKAKTGVTVNSQQARILRQIEELSDYVKNVGSGELEGAAESLASLRQLMIQVE